MPLKTGYSTDTFSENMGTELRSGVPRDQALAIAYAKRREALKRRGMWRGGAVPNGRIAKDHQDDDLEGPPLNRLNSSGEPHTEHLDEITHPMEFMADGGEVEEEEEEAYLRPDVMPPASQDPFAKFHTALRRRPRRMGSY